MPTLLLAGADDAVTPVAGAAALARRMPQAQLVTVPGATHDVLSSESDECAARAVKAFVSRVRVVPCPAPGAGAQSEVDLILDAHLLRPRDPQYIAGVAAPERQPTAAGRAAAAALETLAWLTEVADDGGALAQSRPRPVRVGGLRGGRALLHGRGTRLRGVRYVRDLAVSGTANYEPDGTWQSAQLTLQGPGVNGTMSLAGSTSAFFINGERFQLGGVPDAREEPEPLQASAASRPLPGAPTP